MAENQESYQAPKQHIVETALALLDSPSIRYVNNHPELGQSTEGFDCSGFVRFVLCQSGFHVGDYIGMDEVQRPIRHANEFWDHYGASMQLLPEAGDLVFFSRHGIFPTHMGIMKDEYHYIHAPGNSNTKVTIDVLSDETIATARHMGRILFRTNPIGFKAPTTAHHNPTYRHHQKLVE